jgi:hypothetical protein
MIHRCPPDGVPDFSRHDTEKAMVIAEGLVALPFQTLVPPSFGLASGIPPLKIMGSYSANQEIPDSNSVDIGEYWSMIP